MTGAAEFDAIVQEYEGRISRYLGHVVGDAALAQDLTQETLLRVHGALPQLEAAEARTAWIYRIASNLALDHLRGRTARDAASTLSLEQAFGEEETDEEAASGVPLADARLEQGEMAICIRDHVRELPPLLRECLVLRDIEGLPERTVAEILECSLGAVKVRTHRARRKLRERLERGCCFYQDGRGVLMCEPSGSSASRTKEE
jgi:RNA polymerase sigma-70 factor, ECF subfamily